MDTQRFWEEEIRGFPHGGQGAAIWVVRQDGPEPAGPLRLLFGWAMGQAIASGLAQTPPLGTLHKALTRQREELVHQRDDAALWVEPLACQDGTRGCLGIWFDASNLWRESIFLWGQQLAARLGAVLGQLGSWRSPAMLADTAAPTLFPLPPAARVGGEVFQVGKTLSVRQSSTRPRRYPLPRPMIVPGIPNCVGASRELRRLGERLPGVAASGVNVLLHGESGTGKEIVARALHSCSGRQSGPFVGQNCAALPESLFESELFGHRAGAFTGAAGDKKGLLTAASGGTFFLDEIGDMPTSLQIKLLRVMQERRVRRIGELKSRPVDLRFVAATHKNLEAEIVAGRFRLDLYYRLKVVNLYIPPLRHRPEDVAPLFAYFLTRNGRSGKDMAITERALASLQGWRWPGNVRELENEVMRFVALYPEQRCIRLAHLSSEIQSGESGRIGAEDLGVLRSLDRATEILERYLIRKAIAATEGRKAAAARRLGLSRQGLYKKIARYEMTDLINSK